VWELGPRSAQVRVNGECVTFIDFEYVTPRHLRRLAQYMDQEKKKVKA
jgi:hypothetical protein